MGFLLSQSDLSHKQIFDRAGRNCGSIMPSEVDRWAAVRLQDAVRTVLPNNPIAKGFSP